ncbi:non-specific lipid-transfer protein 1-like [Vitis riparia]|uniref:non-specific lipid-transfer protein 1-like n=1 Tax=Vitis riparia TaxID=96939 RepID=UPI00155A3A9C|nr:non-specific lipid-transfer protein 1-like [Vitis riparia]
MKGVVIALLVALAMVHFMAEPARAITCSDVNKALAPCISYLTGGGAPTSACCDGVRTLKSLSPTTSDRQTACQCAKDAASRNPNIREDAAAALPNKCGVQTDIPISRSTDCSTVS